MTSAVKTSPLLRAESVSHEYDDRLLFEPLTLTVSHGQLVTVTGPNGVGKSTLLRCLAGLIEASEGRIHRPIGFSCAYLGHGLGLRQGLSGTDNLRFALSLFGVRADSERARSAIQRAGLARVIDAPVTQYSAGQRKRLALVRQSLVDQALWLLDEPASNLDSDGRQWMARLCRSHLDSGGAIIMAHHGELQDPLHANTTIRLEPAGDTRVDECA